jgi:hypothetical protein
VPYSAMRFSSGRNVLPASTHKPIFLVGLIWDTLYQDTYSWFVAARLAVNLINERNTLPGWDFRAIFYNDGLTPAGTILGAVALTSQNVRAVVAGTTSAQATAGMFYLAAQDIPMVRNPSFDFARTRADPFECRFPVLPPVTVCPTKITSLPSCVQLPQIAFKEKFSLISSPTSTGTRSVP